MGIERVHGPAEEADALALLEPEVRRWFEATYAAPTPAQRHAVREATRGRNVLVSSPTGSGKTLAAFLTALSDLVRRAKAGALEDRVHVVYVSPLKALNNDVERNLRAPLAGIADVFRADGRDPPEVRVGVRTGDTTASVRAAMLRRPPHILITTPESLAILLSTSRFRGHLAGVRTLIVDEVHAVASSKRGAHLALSLERLAALVRAARNPEPARVGLSATIAPLEEVGAFLFGDRDGVVVDVTAEKGLLLDVRSPVPDPLRAASDDAREALDRHLEQVVEAHGTTIVFTNTRAATERIAFRLRARFEARHGAEIVDADEDDPAPVELDAATAAERDGWVAAHHGSLSREVRLDVEERMKHGRLRCVVTSTSLELGIDVGSVDAVVLLGSPKGVSRTLQRVGRSGHRLTAVSKGRFIVSDRDDLVECVVLAREAQARRVDAVLIPRGPLDVLAQHLLGLAIQGEQDERQVLDLVRRAWPYRDLAAEELRACLAYLAGGGAGGVRRVGWDEASGTFHARGRMTRALYFQNVGTIPSQGTVRVFHGASYIGELEEAYVEELEPNDVFSLNGRAWRFRHTTGMRAHVEPAPGRRPTVPRWGNESLPLPPEVAREVARVRAAWGEALLAEGEAGLRELLLREHPLDEPTAAVVAGYVSEQAAFSTVPRPGEVQVEEFVDDDERRRYVFHVAVGRRATECLARAFARTVSVAHGVSVGVTTSDYGFALAVPRSLVLSAGALRRLFDDDLRPRLVKALESGELVRRRFRHVAERAFLILRNRGPETLTTARAQMSARMLWHVLRREEPDHVVLRETWREVLHDALDLPTAEAVCADVREGRLRVRFVGNLRTPSPFAFHLVLLSGGDGVLAEDRRALLRDLQERVHERIAAGGRAA